MIRDFKVACFLSSLKSPDRMFLYELANSLEQEHTEEVLQQSIPLIRKVYREPQFREYIPYMDTTIDLSVPCIFFCKLQEGIDDNNPGRSNKWFYQLRHRLVFTIFKYLKGPLDAYNFTIDVGDDDSAIHLIPKDTPKHKKIIGSKYYNKLLND